MNKTQYAALLFIVSVLRPWRERSVLKKSIISKFCPCLVFDFIFLSLIWFQISVFIYKIKSSYKTCLFKVRIGTFKMSV